jgi:hypothetical protein
MIDPFSSKRYRQCPCDYQRSSTDSFESVLLNNWVPVAATSMAATAVYVKLTVNYVNIVNVHFTRLDAVDNAD